MTSIKLTSLLAVLAMAAGTASTQAQAPQPITSAEAAMRHHLSLAYPDMSSRPWADRMASTRAADPAAATPSADRHLQRITAGYTREMLDRGGWCNPWMSAAAYSAGEPLLAVRPGEGVTTAGAPSTSPPTVTLARH